MSVTVPWKASGDSPVNGVAEKLDDVRKSLSKEAERLADMAADYSDQARASAADHADNATVEARKQANIQSARASSWWNELIRGALSLGTALALSGRKTAQDMGDNAQSAAKDLSKDLRNLRLTTEPKKTGPDFTPGITLLAGFGTGIALMYFLDPERGKARRNLLRDKLTSWSRQASETARGTARDLSNRTHGALHDANSQLKGQMISGTTDPTSDTQTWPTSTGDGGEYASTSWPEQVPEESVG